jgi:hypothetical protein
MQVAPRYTASNRKERRSFARVRALIVFHHAEPETAEDRNPYVCGNCGHVRRLCTCATTQTQAEN